MSIDHSPRQKTVEIEKSHIGRNIAIGGVATAVVAGVFFGLNKNTSNEVSVSSGFGGSSESNVIFDDACAGRSDIIDTSELMSAASSVSSKQDVIAGMSDTAVMRAENMGSRPVEISASQKDTLLASLEASVLVNEDGHDFSEGLRQGSYDVVWYGEIDTKRVINNQAGDDEGFCIAGNP